MRRNPTAVVLPLLALCACNSSSFVRVVSVNPPEASLYINGEKVGNGNSRPRTFDFKQTQRIYVQATHPDYTPEIEWFDLEKIQQMIDTNTDVKITLRAR